MPQPEDELEEDFDIKDLLGNPPMIKLAIDENFNNNIVRGLLHQQAALDIKRVQDAGLAGADDPTVLEWAATENRVLFTHDVTTMTDFAMQRVAQQQRMPGIFCVGRRALMRDIILDILLIVVASYEREWEGKIVYLPFPS